MGGQTGFAVSLEVGRGTSLAAALALLDLANDLALVHFLEGLHHALPLGDLEASPKSSLFCVRAARC